MWTKIDHCGRPISVKPIVVSQKARVCRASRTVHSRPYAARAGRAPADGSLASGSAGSPSGSRPRSSGRRRMVIHASGAIEHTITPITTQTVRQP